MAIRKERLARALALSEEVRRFWFCGPSDDPDMQTAVTLGFRALAKQLLWAASRVGDAELTELFQRIQTDIEDNIYQAFRLRDDINPVLGRLDELKDEFQGLPSRSLEDILRDRDLDALEAEFERARDLLDGDPASALTAACATVESICKIYIDDCGLRRPNKETIKFLWKVVSDDLGFDPANVEDEDLKRILGGLSSIVDGLGALRTHAGSAHGRGRTRYRIQPRHARLAVHAAHTLVVFVIESWDARNTQ